MNIAATRCRTSARPGRHGHAPRDSHGRALPAARPLGALALAASVLAATACAPSATAPAPGSPEAAARAEMTVGPPSPDPRIGLRPGLLDAEEAAWNLRVLSSTPPADDFVGVTNSDLAFTGSYAIQGNYNGFQVWDISDPTRPSLVTGYLCPASQSDVSVYKDLLFVSGEGLGGRVDCGAQGVEGTVSPDRLRGIRIFDISDIRNPEYIANVQTCRGSHTHSVLAHPDDPDNVYVYVSGSAPVRPAEELPGCSSAPPDEDPNTALFRIEVIKVPLASPEQAAIVSSPRIFEDLDAPPEHGPSAADIAEMERRQEQGAVLLEYDGRPVLIPARVTRPLLDSIMRARGGSGTPTAADTAAVRRHFERLIEERMSAQEADEPTGPSQCHDITLYPGIGLAGGACGGYGILLDIEDPADPVRLHAVADSNFSYWHSATFDNDGTKVLFTDEWGGGGQPKCREGDPYEWGANAIFTIEDGEMRFRSYYKLPAPQTSLENCVAHNGSLIPIPGRDVMVQGWYQGGISVFDWTDPENPVEIAFHDRGPVDPTRMAMGGSWSVYWYNGVIVSSEIARGLDIFDLAPSPYLSENEIEAAKSVELDYLNAQGQPHFEWPPSFALARAYVDQLERSQGLSADRIAAIRRELADAEDAPGAARGIALHALARALDGDASGSSDADKVRMLADAVMDLAAT